MLISVITYWWCRVSKWSFGGNSVRKLFFSLTFHLCSSVGGFLLISPFLIFSVTSAFPPCQIPFIQNSNITLCDKGSFCPRSTSQSAPLILFFKYHCDSVILYFSLTDAQLSREIQLNISINLPLALLHHHQRLDSGGSCPLSHVHMGLNEDASHRWSLFVSLTSTNIVIRYPLISPFPFWNTYYSLKYHKERNINDAGCTKLLYIPAVWRVIAPTVIVESPNHWNNTWGQAAGRQHKAYTSWKKRKVPLIVHKGEQSHAARYEAE